MLSIQTSWVQDSRLHTTTLGQKFWIVDPKTQDGSKILGEESTEIGKSRVPHLTAVQICEHPPCSMLKLQNKALRLGSITFSDLRISHVQTWESEKKTKTKSKDTLLRVIPGCPPRHSSWHSIYIYIYIYIYMDIYIYPYIYNIIYKCIYIYNNNI